MMETIGKTVFDCPTDIGNGLPRLRLQQAEARDHQHREARRRRLVAAAGPDGELRAHHGGLGRGAAQEAPLGVPAADGARDAPRRVSARPLF